MRDRVIAIQHNARSNHGEMRGRMEQNRRAVGGMDERNVDTGRFEPANEGTKQLDLHCGECRIFIIGIRDLLKDAAAAGPDSLTEAQWHYLREASRRQVKFAHAQLEHNRHHALEKLGRLFRIGTVPHPDGRYEGELVDL